MSASLPRNEKIVERSALAKRLDALRDSRRIVFTNGCFDILHPGHVDLLARCRALGNLLVVGVNDDDSVSRLNKIPPRPINPLNQRMAVLAGLESVDFVTSFSEDTPLKIITELKPHILVKGGDWSLNNIVGRDVVEALGGEVHSLPLLPGYSTTALIEKILQLGK